MLANSTSYAASSQLIFVYNRIANTQYCFLFIFLFPLFSVHTALLSRFQATEDDNLSFPSLLFVLWQTIVPDRSVCAQPPVTKWTLPYWLQLWFKILTRQQALPHPPLANSALHWTLSRQQHKFREDLDPQSQLDREQLAKIYFLNQPVPWSYYSNPLGPKRRNIFSENGPHLTFPFLKSNHKQLLMKWSSENGWKAALQRCRGISGTLVRLCCTIDTRTGVLKKETVPPLEVKLRNFKTVNILRSLPVKRKTASNCLP